jgi:hypothetical protein
VSPAWDFFDLGLVAAWALAREEIIPGEVLDLLNAHGNA